MFGREDLLGVQEAAATSKKKESVTELLHGMVMLSVSSGGPNNARSSPVSTPTSEEDSMDTSVSLTSQGLTTSTHDYTEMDSDVSESELDAPNPTSSSFGSFFHFMFSSYGAVLIASKCLLPGLVCHVSHSVTQPLSRFAVLPWQVFRSRDSSISIPLTGN